MLFKKKKPPLQNALVVESGDSVFRPCFIRLFCEVTLDSNVGSSEFVGLIVVTRLDRVLEVFFPRR